MFAKSDRVERFNPGSNPGVIASAQSLRSQYTPVQHSQIRLIALRSKGILPAKRAIDILISLAAIIFFGPLMLLIACLIKITDGGTVFFAHRRIGYNGTGFSCLKFRTMAPDSEKALADYLAKNGSARRQWNELHKLTHDPRITRLGQFLRLSSLDELPQFFCVLRGDMSIVGPRPIVENERSRYGRYFADYCVVRPGLTGLWQVSGRNDTSYRRRVAIDVFYCRNWSLALDLLIMMKTPWAIINQRGVY